MSSASSGLCPLIDKSGLLPVTRFEARFQSGHRFRIRTGVSGQFGKPRLSAGGEGCSQMRRDAVLQSTQVLCFRVGIGLGPGQPDLANLYIIPGKSANPVTWSLWR